MQKFCKQRDQDATGIVDSDSVFDFLTSADFHDPGNSNLTLAMAALQFLRKLQETMLGLTSLELRSSHRLQCHLKAREKVVGEKRRR